MKNRRIISRFAPLIGCVLILGIWFLVSKLEWYSSYVLPGPAKVLESFVKMLQSGELLTDIAVSFGRVLKGFFIAFGLAFFLAMVQFLIPKAEKYYEYVLEFFRNVPPLSMIPLLILW